MMTAIVIMMIMTVLIVVVATVAVGESEMRLQSEESQRVILRGVARLKSSFVAEKSKSNNSNGQGLKDDGVVVW